MKLRHLFTAVVFCFAAVVTAQEMQMPPIPKDPAIRTGKLDNGLTYYVRQNGYPEHRVNFYIAQRVGSIQEEDNQRGLAHFLEHMAFNGSVSFDGNGMIEWLRSVGVEFGADLNAYTAVDQTVYRICNVPSARIEVLDSCLLALKDWSCGLLLEPEEIDKERGVIHEEWRLRSSATMRIFERNLAALYPGSKYGARFPIGTMEVIDNFEYDALRKYYEKWYRPDNQAIIVVGDIDVDATEEKIKQLFADIKLVANAAPVLDEPVPDNEEAIIIVDKDKEQTVDVVMLMFKSDAVPDEAKYTIDYMLNDYAIGLVCAMFNDRMRETAQDPTCPFISASMEYGDYIYAKTKAAIDIDFLPKEGRSEEAMAAVMREVLRAVKNGFTASEFERAKSDVLSRLEKTYTNRDKRDNHVYGNICTEHFLANEPMAAIDDEYMLMQQILPMIPVEAMNAVLPELISDGDQNLVVLGMYNEKDGRTYPTPESLKAAIDGVRGEEIAAWVDDVKDEPLIAQLPKAGKIVAEKTNDTLGFTELTLSNGVKVMLKKTDFKDDEVLLQATSKGGFSLLSEADRQHEKLFNAAIGYSGLGNFSSTELSKALAGKQANADLTMSNLHESVTGHSTPKDIETMFQMVYLYFTNINKDEKSYATLVTMLENQLKNRDLSPDVAFSDSISATLYDHNPRFMSLQLSDLQHVSYDRILAIAKERTANAADFVFTIVGNFDEATVRQLLEQYIASLPASNKRENFKPITTYHQGKTENVFRRKMETPKANARIMWYNNSEPYSLENDVLVDAAGQVLEMIYLKKIREDASAAYSTGAGGAARLGGDVPMTMLVGVCPMKPEMADVALEIMETEVVALGESVDAEMLAKVKELMLKRADENARKNGHWLSVLNDYDEYGVDTFTNYKNIINNLTPEAVAAFVKNVILAGGNSVKVVMLPEE